MNQKGSESKEKSKQEKVKEEKVKILKSVAHLGHRQNRDLTDLLMDDELYNFINGKWKKVHGLD